MVETASAAGVAEEVEEVPASAAGPALWVEEEPSKDCVSWFRTELNSLSASPTGLAEAADDAAPLAEDATSCSDVRNDRSWEPNWLEGLDCGGELAELAAPCRFCPVEAAPFVVSVEPDVPGAREAIRACNAWSAAELFELFDTCTSKPF